MSTMQPIDQRPMHIVVTSTKSVGVSLLLTFFFGPFGLFYATVKGALIVLFGVPIAFTVVAIVLGAAAAGAGSGGAALGIAGLMFLGCTATMWVLSWVWAVTAVNAYNRKLTAGVFV